MHVSVIACVSCWIVDSENTALALAPFEGGPAAVLAVQTVQRPGGFNVLYTTILTDSTSPTQEN